MRPYRMIIHNPSISKGSFMMRLSQAITTSATRRPLSYRSPIIFADKKITLGASSFHPNHFSPSFRSLKIGKDIHVIYRSTRWLLWWRFAKLGFRMTAILTGEELLYSHTEHIKVQKVQYATDNSNFGICLVLMPIQI